MTNVYFVRHAEPNYDNHDDRSRELTEKGLLDRISVTEYLKDKEIHAVLSSPYRRAVDTVKHFADAQGMAIELIEDFRERRVDSVWIDDFNAFAQKQWADFEYKLADGECLREVQARNIEALKDVLRRYRGRNVAVGSHGTAIATILHYFDDAFGYDDFRRIQKIMPMIVRFAFDGEKCLSIGIYDPLNRMEL